MRRLGHVTKQRLTLVVYLVFLGLLSVPLSLMMGAAWRARGISFQFINTARSFVGWSLEEISLVILGLYLGLLFLLWLDDIKRWQAFLLTIATAVGLATLSLRGLLLPNVNVVANPTEFVVGILGGIVLGTGVQDLNRGLVESILNEAERVEFRRAMNIFFVLVALLVGFSLLDRHLIDLEPQSEVFLGDLAVSIFFLGVFRGFLRYELEQEYVVLAPRRSGKSTFMVGAYHAAIQENRSPRNPSDPLGEMWTNLTTATDGWGGIDEPDPRGLVKKLEFRYLKGRFFRYYAKPQAIDYAGHHFNENLVNHVDRRLSESGWLSLPGSIPSGPGLVLYPFTLLGQLVSFVWGSIAAVVGGIGRGIRAVFGGVLGAFSMLIPGGSDSSSSQLDLPDSSTPSGSSVDDTDESDTDDDVELPGSTDASADRKSTDGGSIVDTGDLDLGGDDEGYLEETTAVYDLIATRIVDSETVLLLLDASRFVDTDQVTDKEDGLKVDMAEYLNISLQLLRRLSGEKELLVVVTKADHLIPEYLDHQEFGADLPWESETAFNEFADFTDQFMRDRQELAAVLAEAQVDTVYPVFYEMDTRESESESKPMPAHPVNPVGFNRVLRALEGS